MVKESREKEDVSWNEAVTLEVWVERMLRSGYTAIVKNMMNALPENKKEKYRNLYKRVMSEKRDGKQELCSPDGRVDSAEDLRGGEVCSKEPDAILSTSHMPALQADDSAGSA